MEGVMLLPVIYNSKYPGMFCSPPKYSQVRLALRISTAVIQHFKEVTVAQFELLKGDLTYVNEV